MNTETTTTVQVPGGLGAKLPALLDSNKHNCNNVELGQSRYDLDRENETPTA